MKSWFNEKWRRLKTTWLWKTRAFLTGAVAFLVALLISRTLQLTHSSPTENYYSIAWTYVTLAVAILSILYPFSLALRDSLTARLFAAYGKLQETKLDYSNEDFHRNHYEPLQRFRKLVFDIQLPILATFTFLSVARVLFCLISLGPLTLEKQIIEPQIYVFAYLIWSIWFAGVVLWFKPYGLVESLENIVLGLPPFDPTVPGKAD